MGESPLNFPDTYTSLRQLHPLLCVSQQRAKTLPFTTTQATARKLLQNSYSTGDTLHFHWFCYLHYRDFTRTSENRLKTPNNLRPSPGPVWVIPEMREVEVLRPLSTLRCCHLKAAWSFHPHLAVILGLAILSEQTMERPHFNSSHTGKTLPCYQSL